MKRKTIKIGEDLWKQLFSLRITQGKSSMDEVIRELVGGRDV